MKPKQANYFIIAGPAVALILFAAWAIIVPSGTSSAARAPTPRFAPKGCVDCHQKEASAYTSQKFVHGPVRELKCETCHKRHGIVGAVILEKESSELCYTCHAAQKQKFEQGKQHTAMKGSGKQRVGCTNCHNPHASSEKGLLKKTGNELCFTCHEKQPFGKKVTHAPVTQNCQTCHDAHTSGEPNVLSKPVKTLCQQCHSVTAPNFLKAHGGYPMAGTACTSCRPSFLHTGEASAGLGSSRHDDGMRHLPRGCRFQGALCPFRQES